MAGSAGVDSPSRGVPGALLLAGLAALLIGGGLAPLAQPSADVLPATEFIAEANTHVLPALATGTTSAWLQPDALAHAWHRLSVALTGQWDARVLGVLHLGLAAATLIAALAPLARQVSPRAWLALGFSGVALLHFRLPAAGTGAGALSFVWWIGAVVHLTWASPEQSRTRQVFGWVAAALGLAASSLGLAPILATCWHAWRTPATPTHRWTATFAAALGAALVALRGAAATEVPTTGPSLAWPLAWDWTWPVLWAPLIFVTGRWLLRPDSVATHGVWLGRAGLASLLALAGFAWTGVAIPAEWSRVALWLNLACLTALPGRAPLAGRHMIAAVSWLIVVVNGLVQLEAGGSYGRVEPREVELAVRADAERARAATLRADPRLQAVLPLSHRAALAVVPESSSHGFSSVRPTELAAPDALPNWSSWDATGGAAARGEFTSGWLRTETSLLQIRVAGQLRPPETNVVLVTEDGREIAALGESGEIGPRWKRLNFRAPEGRFRLVARDESATAWLAFTAPVETSPVGRTVAKVTATGSLWIAFGIGAIALGLARGGRQWVAAPSWPALEWRVLPWLALGAYGLFCAWHIDHIAGPNDSGGYLNLAKTLARGDVLGSWRALPLDDPAARDPSLYLPSTAKLNARGEMVPEYPPGLPLLIALASTVLPLAVATSVVLWLHLIAGVLVTRFAARVFGLPDGWAWLAAWLIGLNSVYLFHTLQPQSDGPSLVWITAAVACAWRAREQSGYAWLAGGATAIAVLLRPANVLCFLPVLACLYDRPKLLLRLALAGLPAALWLFWFNHRLYGSPLLTGYGKVVDWWAWRYIPPTLVAYARWLPEIFTPVILLAFAAPWVRALRSHAGVVLTLWAGGFLVFYVCYWATYSDWFNMRFVLPGMPALVIGGLVALRHWSADRTWEFFPTARRSPIWPTVALCAALLGITVSHGWRNDLLLFVHACASHRAPVLWFEERVAGRAAVIAEHASNAVWHYSKRHFLLRRTHPAVKSPEFLARVEAAGIPVYALNQHWERPDYVFGPQQGDGLPDLPGRWEPVATLWRGEYRIWRWHPPTEGEGAARQAAR